MKRLQLIFLVLLCCACSSDDQNDSVQNLGEETINNVEVIETTSCSENLIGNGPNSQWFTSISGSQEESHGHYILACSDGGFLQVGETGIYPNTARILVVKTSQSGNLLWQKEFGSLGANLGNYAREVSNGYLIAGAIENDAVILKLTKDEGAVIWQNTYNNGGIDAYESLVEIPSGLAAVGYANAQDGTNTFYTEGVGLVSFLDTNGSQISNLQLSASMSHAYRVVFFQNELFISGLTEGAEDYSLIKMNTEGTIVWQNTYGGASSDHCFAMDVNDSGDIFLSGHTLSNTQNWDTYTMKINSNGVKQWELKKGNPRGFDAQYIHDEVWDIKATDDGGCILVAGTGDEYEAYSATCGEDEESSDTWKVYLIKINASGAIIWDKAYGVQEADWAGEAIALTLDGGAVVAVDNASFGFLKIAAF